MSQPVHEQFEPQLKAIETVVMDFYKAHPDLTDAVVDGVYEELSRRYRAEATSFDFKPGRLDGLREDLHAALLPVTESLCGRPAAPSGLAAISAEDLRQCLNRLRKSVALWTKEMGRQGYLKFLSRHF